MSRREALRLRDTREAIATIRGHIAAGDFDRKTSDAVLYNLVVIGEAAAQISDETRARASAIPWSKIVGLRNLIAHEYFRIDLDATASTEPHCDDGFCRRSPRLRSLEMGVTIDDSFDGIDWERAKADLSADAFDNGRTAEALRRSFRQSQHVAFARDGARLVGMARLLSDGVCNAYLLDVWTASAYRRRGIASAMIRYLLLQVPGQHVGLQTDNAQQFYESLGFKPQPEFWSCVVGSWLDNDANR